MTEYSEWFDDAGASVEWCNSCDSPDSWCVECVKPDGHALQHASEALRDDRDFVRSLLRESGSVLAYVNSQWASDKDLVLVAVRQCPAALQYADDAPKGDPDVVRAAADVAEERGRGVKRVSGYACDRTSARGKCGPRGRRRRHLKNRREVLPSPHRGTNWFVGEGTDGQVIDIQIYS